MFSWFKSTQPPEIKGEFDAVLSVFEDKQKDANLLKVTFTSKAEANLFVAKLGGTRFDPRDTSLEEGIPFTKGDQPNSIFYPTYVPRNSTPQDPEYAVNFGSKATSEKFMQLLGFRPSPHKPVRGQITVDYEGGLVKYRCEDYSKTPLDFIKTPEEYWQETALYFKPNSKIFTDKNYEMVITNGKPSVKIKQSGKIKDKIIEDESTLFQILLDKDEKKEQDLALFKQISEKHASKQKLYHPDTQKLCKNSLALLNQDEKLKAQVIEGASNTYPILHKKSEALIREFLAFKKMYGNDIEKKVYAQMSFEGFIARLLSQRPPMFLGTQDLHFLHNERMITHPKTDSNKNFNKIGTDQEVEPFVLQDYLSQDERLLSSLIGISGQTPLINEGEINNGGVIKREKCQPEVVCIGMVGERFELPNASEWRLLMISETQNTAENGYGASKDDLPSDPKKQYLKMWAKYFGKTHLPTYAEIQKELKDHPENAKNYFVHQPQNAKPSYLALDDYREKIKVFVEMYLLEANARAKQAGKKGYVHVLPVGLGVWKISSKSKQLQQQIMMDAYISVLKEHKFSNLSDIDFCAFKEVHLPPDSKKIGDISLKSSTNPPGKKLTGPDQHKLKIIQYAWDGFAEPGNEFAGGGLTLSGDPAAACCSYIWLTQNSHVNPCIDKNIHTNRFHICSVEELSQLKDEVDKKPEDSEEALVPRMGS